MKDAGWTGLNGLEKWDGAVVLGCVGGKGGQGASMFAAGLSSVLSRERSTVLVDLDLNSTHRHLLEREDCAGISNLATVIDEISPLGLGNVVHTHPLGFYVLPGLRALEEDSLLNEVNLNLIFKLLGRSYNYIVVDISSNHRLIAEGALALCSLALLVVQPDLLSLRCAMRVLELSGRCGGGSTRWGLVINRSDAGDLVQPFQVSGLLETPLLAVIPEDPPAGEDFSNFMKGGLAGGHFRAAVEQMALRLKLVESSTSTSNTSLSSRCLKALRERSRARQLPELPQEEPSRSSGGAS